MTTASSLILWFSGGLVAGFSLRFFSKLPSALRKD